MRSNAAHRSAALRGAASTRTGATESVLDREFPSCRYFPEAIQEDFPANSAHRQIRLAAVIDKLSAAASYRSIEARAPIQANQVNPPCLSSQERPHDTAFGFPIADALAGILDDPLSRRDRFVCKYTKALDARSANREFETGEF